MRLFDKRPLCFACAAALILSPVFAYAGLFSVYAALAVCAVCAAVSFFLFPAARRVLLVTVTTVCVVAVSFLVCHRRTAGVPVGDEVTVSGYLMKDSENDGTRIVNITEIDGRRVSVRAAQRAEGGSAFEEFTASAVLSRYSGVNASYYRGKGVDFSAELSGAVFTGRYHKGVRYFAERIRGAAERCFYRVSDEGGILSRVFLGSSSAPPGFTSDMRSLGLSHLLAVSGLHVTALLLGLDLILGKLLPGKRAKGVILAAAALLYAAVTGFSGSVLRASVMYLIMSLAPVLIRRDDRPTTLCAAAVLIITASPSSVFDTGFLLSFTATLGIITVGLPVSRAAEKRYGEKRRFLRRIVSSSALTASALLFTLPVVAFTYGRLAPGALFFNLFFPPLVAIILYVCPYILIFSRVPLLGRGLGLFCDGICSVLKAAARFFSGRAPSVSVRFLFVIPLILTFAAVLAVMSFITKKTRAYIAAFLAFCVVFSAFAAAFFLTFSKRTVIMISTDKYGDTVAVASGGKATVYDFSTGGGRGFYPLAEALLRRGITHADYVLCAEPTDRHLQSAVRIAAYFDVDSVCLPEKLEKPAEMLLHENVTPLRGSGRFGAAEFRISGETRLLRIGGSVYCGELGENDVPPFSGGKTVYGSRVKAGVLPDVPGRTYRVPEYDGKSADGAVTVIYLD